MIYDEKKTLAYSSNIEKATRVIVTYGRITSLANEVAEGLGDCAVIKLIKIFPLDIEKIATLLNGKELAYVLEESIKTGGVGEKLQPALNKAQKVYIHAIDGFVEHGELNDLYNFCGFTRDNIINNIKKLT